MLIFTGGLILAARLRPPKSPHSPVPTRDPPNIRRPHNRILSQYELGTDLEQTHAKAELKFMRGFAFKNMATQRFIQYAVGSKKKPATVYLRCHVKPGASKVREGITSLTDDAIELCVSAAAREGEANKAVVAVLSEVRPFQPCL